MSTNGKTKKAPALRVGIAGYGIVGARRRHYIDLHPEMTTVAVCDQKFKGQSALPDGIPCFSSYKKLLEVPLDAVFVSLPNYMAAEVTIAALKRGLHVFCEKPPGRDVADIARVIAVERRSPGLALKYGFNHRYHQSVVEAVRIMKSGELGTLLNMRGVYGKSTAVPFEGSWRAERRYAGGGILLDQGIHMVDIMLLFAGRFTEVKSFVSNSYWKHDVEDNAYALLKDAQGRVAMLHSSATQWQHRFMLDIAFSQGYLTLSGILSSTKSYGEEKLTIGRRADSTTGTDREETATYLNDNSWRDEVADFAAAVRSGGAVKHGTSAEALAAMETVYQIYCADPAWRDAYDIAHEETAK